MPYAQGRTFRDADSHLMELHDWLPRYADPGIRERIRPLYLGGAGALAEQAVRDAMARRGDPEAARALEDRLMHAKGWSALGAFDPAERSRALDLLGFDSQLVFSTFAATQFASDDSELLFGGARAHNRAMAEFCAGDERLIAVGFVPLTDPERAALEVDEAIRLGCGAVLVPSAPPRDKSPTHPDYDPIWRTLEERDVPFMLHIGGGGRPLRRAFHQNGKPPTTDFLGGGENVRSKDFMVIHHPPEIFLACMVLDGVFERFPGLRGGCIEQGALWVVPWLERLDIAQQTFRKTEPALALPLKASDYVHRQLWFTPFPTEPVGWMIENAGDDLFLFSSDYPHPEGGRDPLGRFEASLASIGEAAKERFYAGNFADMMGMGRAA
ncbi:MAG TPA: amidohydrolase family protein [Gemmatimonadales bacterium]|nr:amidohydrolase family protein [Gemmatimonadales bacterium]